MKVLFACSAGEYPEIGTGHFIRMFAVANQMVAESRGLDNLVLHFFGKLTDKQIELLQESKIHYSPANNPEISANELFLYININRFDVVIIDNLDLKFHESLRRGTIDSIIITIDNFIENEEFDLCLASTRASPNVFRRDRFIAFPEPFTKKNELLPIPNSFEVFCSFGGFDHNSYSVKLINLLDSIPVLLNIKWTFAVTNPKILMQQFTGRLNSNIEILNSADEYFSRLNSCDLALVSGGLTMFQSLYLAKPTVVVPQYLHQRESAIEIANKNACLIYDPNTDSDNFSGLIELVKSLRDAPDKLDELSLFAKLEVPENQIGKLSEIFKVYERLEWDSIFFGFPIARIHVPQINQRIIDFALMQAQKDKIKCIYYLDSGSSYGSIKTAIENNFDLVDTRLTFEKFLYKSTRITKFDNFRFATGEDALALQEIAQEVYLSSRYFFDTNFNPDLSKLFYAEWIYKSITGDLDDFVIVCELNNEVAGFVSVKLSRNHASIGLVGVKAKYRGHDVAQNLLSHLEGLLVERKIPMLRVVTQGRNIAAQRLYSKCGYLPTKCEYWFHYWT